MSAATMVFLALAILGWGVGALFDKVSLNYMDPSGAFYLRTLANMVLFAPLLIWKYPETRNAVMTENKLGPVFVVSSVIVSMAGVYFYLKALSGGEASRIVPLSSIYPLVTFALALVFLDESFTLNKLTGALLLAAGIYFISK